MTSQSKYVINFIHVSTHVHVDYVIKRQSFGRSLSFRFSCLVSFSAAKHPNKMKNHVLAAGWHEWLAYRVAARAINEGAAEQD